MTKTPSLVTDDCICDDERSCFLAWSMGHQHLEAWAWGLGVGVKKDENPQSCGGNLSVTKWKPPVGWRLLIVFDCRVVISESGRLKASSTLVWEILCSVLSQRDISSRSQAGVCVMICLIKTILGNRYWPGFPRGHAKGAHTHDDWESDVPCLSFSLSS